MKPGGDAARPLSIPGQGGQWHYDERMLSEIIQQAEAIAVQDRWLGRSEACPLYIAVYVCISLG